MFRFSIRELMLVTTVVALGVAWFVEHTRAQAALKSAKEACGKAEFWERINRESEISFREQLAEYGLDFGCGCAHREFCPQDRAGPRLHADPWPSRRSVCRRV